MLSLSTIVALSRFSSFDKTVHHIPRKKKKRHRQRNSNLDFYRAGVYSDGIKFSQYSNQWELVIIQELQYCALFKRILCRIKQLTSCYNKTIHVNITKTAIQVIGIKNIN